MPPDDFPRAGIPTTPVRRASPLAGLADVARSAHPEPVRAHPATQLIQAPPTAMASAVPPEVRLSPDGSKLAYRPGGTPWFVVQGLTTSYYAVAVDADRVADWVLLAPVAELELSPATWLTADTLRDFVKDACIAELTFWSARMITDLTVDRHGATLTVSAAGAWGAVCHALTDARVVYTATADGAYVIRIPGVTP